MEEIQEIIGQYSKNDINQILKSPHSIHDFCISFYQDALKIYEIVLRVKNIERNPTGFSLHDAAILGLLVRSFKILCAILTCYERNDGYTISLLDRQAIETVITAKYLLLKGDEAIVDYRKCSYKDRINILVEAQNKPQNFDNKPGQELLKSINNKLKMEGWTLSSFEFQKRNKWKVAGKSFYQIFDEVMPSSRLYKYLYGMPSESIHGSWNDSLDFHLGRNPDGTFSPYPFTQDVDIRFMTPLLRLCHDSFILWLKHIDAEDPCLVEALQWTCEINLRLFESFEIKQFDNEP